MISPIACTLWSFFFKLQTSHVYLKSKHKHFFLKLRQLLHCPYTVPAFLHPSRRHTLHLFLHVTLQFCLHPSIHPSIPSWTTDLWPSNYIQAISSPLHAKWPRNVRVIKLWSNEQYPLMPGTNYVIMPALRLFATCCLITHLSVVLLSKMYRNCCIQLFILWQAL